MKYKKITEDTKLELRNITTDKYYFGRLSELNLSCDRGIYRKVSVNKYIYIDFYKKFYLLTDTEHGEIRKMELIVNSMREDKSHVHIDVLISMVNL